MPRRVRTAVDAASSGCGKLESNTRAHGRAARGEEVGVGRRLEQWPTPAQPAGTISGQWGKCPAVWRHQGGDFTRPEAKQQPDEPLTDAERAAYGASRSGTIFALRTQQEENVMSPPTTVAADLLQQYDRPGPRYTSYPTAVEFNESVDQQAYLSRLAEARTHASEPLSLYVHLPFCEHRCSFCGCLVIITHKREVAARYLGYLHREVEMLATQLGDRRRIVQYHWGGGTPTYLTPTQMQALQDTVTRHFEIDPQAEVAVEVDPRVTTHEQIALLRSLGFNRLSMGVQDFTPRVQHAIDRHQGEVQTRELFTYARAAGFESLNVDLIYGLPFQTIETFDRTLESVVDMRPERVAVYSYAHVPWLRGNQKRIDPSDLPPRDLKFELLLHALDRFLDAGYIQIGMDHFALPSDVLAIAAANRTLHRNFMGYTTKPATDMLGVGVSAISDVRGAFTQNVKKLSTYYAALDARRFPVERGYILEADDLVRRHVITQLMCNFYLDRRQVEHRFGISFGEYFRWELATLTADPGPVVHGLVRIDSEKVEVLPPGRLFIRNICMVFDRYRRAHTEEPAFSRTI